MSAIVIRATLPTRPASAACVIRRTSDGAYLDTTAGTWATVGTLPTNHAVTLTADANFPDQYRGSLTTTGMAAFGTDLNVDLFVYDAGTSPPTSLTATCDWVKAGDNNLAPATVTLSPSDLTTIANAVISAGGADPTTIATAVWASGTRTLTAFTFSVTASSVTDKTGYSLTQAFPAHFSDLAIVQTTGLVTATNGGSGGSSGSSATLNLPSGTVTGTPTSSGFTFTAANLGTSVVGSELLGRKILYMSGAKAGDITAAGTYTISGSSVTVAFATSQPAPAAGDTVAIVGY